PSFGFRPPGRTRRFLREHPSHRNARGNAFATSCCNVRRGESGRGPGRGGRYPWRGSTRDPMRVAYLDCFSGVAGDMFLGALLHAGLPLDALKAELAKLGLDEFDLKVERTWRDAMEGVRVDVRTSEGATPPHRGLSDIKTILVGSALDPQTKEWATAVFTRLAEAEAQVHGTTVDEIHFHEVGATDAIVDIVG